MATICGVRPSEGVETRKLRVKVICGVKLAKKDIFGASDPYVRISLYEGGRNSSVIECAQTKTIRKNLNPVWNEEFIFRIVPRNNTLLFEVFDENRITRDDFLGLVEIELSTACIQSEDSENIQPSRQYLLRPRTSKSRVKGNLELYLAYIEDDDDVPEATRDFEEDSRDWEIVRSDSVRQEMQDSFPQNQNESNNGEDSSAQQPPRTDYPLPPNWECRIDGRGRRFYINHTTRSTHWQLPTENDSEPLPPGWESKVDNIGRTYYVDHANRITTWQRPSADSTAQTADEERRQAADNFRQRRCVSHEDTLSISGTDDNALAAAAGPIQRLHTLGNSVDNIAIEDDDGPLPVGWTKSQAPNGKVFYVDHNMRMTSWEDPRRQNRARSITMGASKDMDLTQRLGQLPEGWEERIHTDGRSFFIDHNTKKTTWEDPRLKLLNGPSLQYSSSYKQKYDNFRAKLRKPTNVPNKFDIKVKRKSILEDSFRCIMSVKRTDLLKTRLWIEFDDEQGLDYGGVSREWFYLLSKEMFNPYYGLFEYSAIDDYTLQINPKSGVANPEHLSYFKFIGRVCGMAVFHGKLIDGYFIRPFYKMMLGKSITLDDMESVDSEYYNSLKWIEENDPECLVLSFSIVEEVFGQTEETELIPGGKDIPVSEDNKLDYIKNVINWRFSSRVKEQMSSFLTGFNEIIPNTNLQIFDANEIELLLAGLQDIDVQDWKSHSQYRRDYNANHPVIINFWKTVYSFNNETRSKLLQFVTGTSRVPMNGFKELYGSNGPQLFTIEHWGLPTDLPRAHTCFNRLDLPAYTTYDELRKKLLIAIENSEGFDGVD
ncbi:DgyrCDS2857 [Dimorphilus gyrociliatus]|uniref:E3 ubiquitin-protein ligase n=1 Tax=Dimorphilus gyrociliatus TaxID=2664684 RepID=A0A7I8VBI4_9ANNE|nr:DgyrCDS2857 [Dimorphilus gyrociliatus]